MSPEETSTNIRGVMIKLIIHFLNCNCSFVMDLGHVFMMLENSKNLEGQLFFLQDSTFINDVVMFLFLFSGKIDGIKDFVSSCDFSVMERDA